MKTKFLAPWNVKPGDTILVYSFPDQVKPHPAIVERVTKSRSPFTGATLWRHHYTDPLTKSPTWILSHGRRPSHHPRIHDWQAEKILCPA